MVKIPLGPLQDRLGRRLPEEGPVRGRRDRGLAIDRGPVTVTQFTEFVEETDYVDGSACGGPQMGFAPRNPRSGLLMAATERDDRLGRYGKS